jgi:hypothetical protein
MPTMPLARHPLPGRAGLLLGAPLVLLALFAPAPARGVITANDPSWRLQSTSDGIALYRASVKGSGVVPVKATVTIPGTITDVSLVLEDLARRREWIGTRTESVLLERPNPYEQVEYLRVHLPWPATDRSALIRARISVSDDAQRATIAVHSIASHPADTLPKLVRSQVHTSTFDMVQKPGRVDVVALVFVDPRGWIPKWIVNYFAGRVARSTVAGLRRQVGRQLYPASQREAMQRRIHAYQEFQARQPALR